MPPSPSQFKLFMFPDRSYSLDVWRKIFQQVNLRSNFFFTFISIHFISRSPGRKIEHMGIFVNNEIIAYCSMFRFVRKLEVLSWILIISCLDNANKCSRENILSLYNLCCIFFWNLIFKLSLTQFLSYMAILLENFTVMSHQFSLSIF